MLNSVLVYLGFIFDEHLRADLVAF